mmetsp:Transcript_13821/g.38186  ORF Transcript_13821/g.38186 Transcript_13821/m.38186 type:complete len:1280 (-) Transcript_13821:115-3954(-)
MAKEGELPTFGIDAARDLLASWSMDLTIDHVDTLCSSKNETVPGTPPMVIMTRSSTEESPISRFRRDTSRHGEALLLPQGASQSQDGQMSISIRPSLSLDDGNGEDDEAGTLKVHQARAAISAVSDPTPSRLSDARIQQILVAAMRLEKDNEPSVPNQPVPHTPESTASNRSVTTTAFNSLSLGQPPSMPIFSLAEGDENSSTAPFPDEDSQQVAVPLQEAGLTTTNENENSSGESFGSSTPGNRENDYGPIGFSRQEEHIGTGMTEEPDTKDEGEKLHSILSQAKITGVVEDDGVELKPAFNDGVESDSGKARKLEPPPMIRKTVFDTTTPRIHNRKFAAVFHPQLLEKHALSSEGHAKVRMGVNEEKNDTEGIVVHSLLELPPDHPELHPLEDDITETIVDKNPFRRRTCPDEEPSSSSDKVPRNIRTELRLMKSVSMTESDVGSIEGLPIDIQSTLRDAEGRDEILQRLDGVEVLKEHPDHVINEANAETRNGEVSIFDSFGLSFLWERSKAADKGNTTAAEEKRGETLSPSSGNSDQYWDGAINVLGHCSPIVPQKNNSKNSMRPTLGRSRGSPSNIATIHSNDTDCKLHSWVNTHYEIQEAPPSDGTYEFGRSRTVVVHEIKRGDWTWCTAWSPRGDRLALATENHHLAVVETTSSTVWRVRHDKRLRGPAVGSTTHSIRSISWGENFIATGGTGNAVSIISPNEPYSVVHVIKDTGFVGSLDWRTNSNILAIGSRSNKAMVVQIRSSDDGKLVESEITFQVEFPNWVNRVAFNPSGDLLAVGNATGVLNVYSVDDSSTGTPKITDEKSVRLDDAILAMDWSSDGRWLYAGGEDFHLSVFETESWTTVNKQDRSRWVQCIASSASGSHVALGGISSEVSILDVRQNWETVMGIELKGLVPLSASWHPNDQALALTGQTDSVLVVETSNARHMRGHHLHSMSSILSINFSPDGKTAIIGNEVGIVTFFAVSQTTFEITYELVVVLNDRLSIDCSLNGHFSVIGSKDALIVVGPSVRARKLRSAASGFSIQRVIRDVGETNCVSIDRNSRYIAVAGDRTRVFDATKDFRQVRSWRTGSIYATAWSPDGSWLATIGQSKTLHIYDTRSELEDRWRKMFSLECDFVGQALAWGPTIVGGLAYLAYSGAKVIWIMEIRTLEETWEAILRIPRDGNVRDLDWNADGLLAAGIDDGTVSIIDLAYLQSGIAVNEKDYNWQRQALTCFTEIRRNRGRNCIQTVKWIPSTHGCENLLALGGTDGEVEIINLAERRRGWAKTTK